MRVRVSRGYGILVSIAARYSQTACASRQAADTPRADGTTDGFAARALLGKQVVSRQPSVACRQTTQLEVGGRVGFALPAHVAQGAELLVLQSARVVGVGAEVIGRGGWKRSRAEGRFMIRREAFVADAGAREGSRAAGAGVRGS